MMHPPDYTTIRDRTLNKLKIGRQSAAGKAVDTFIQELKRAFPPTVTTSTDAQNPLKEPISAVSDSTPRGKTRLQL